MEKTQRDWIIKVCDELKETLIKKDNDYGSAFSQRFQKSGILSAFIRIEDKYLRLDNLISGAEQRVKDEGIADTVQDLAGYCMLTLIELMKLQQGGVDHE